jgi:pyruvate/2-oxoglutarate dehydrogenase complex dihydrolipoamide acyltransferase (E2) component
MIPRMRAASLVVVGALLASCAGASAPAPAAPAATATARSSPAPTAGAAAASATAAAPQAARPAFLSVRLTDVRTGEQFTLGGFPGKVVLGIAMAVW